MDEIRSFLLGGKTHLLRYEGLVTAILTALIVLALLIVSGGEGKKERSVLWSGAGTAVVLLCPGVCMLLEKLTEGSLGDGKSYMAVPAAAIAAPPVLSAVLTISTRIVTESVNCDPKGNKSCGGGNHFGKKK